MCNPLVKPSPVHFIWHRSTTPYGYHGGFLPGFYGGGGTPAFGGGFPQASSQALGHSGQIASGSGGAFLGGLRHADRCSQGRRGCVRCDIGISVHRLTTAHLRLWVSSVWYTAGSGCSEYSPRCTLAGWCRVPCRRGRSAAAHRGIDAHHWCERCPA